MSRRGLLLLGRVVTSGGLFLLLAYLLDLRDVASRLTRMDGRWVVAALGLSIAQVVGSAWRWRFTAHRLDLELPTGRAVAEYYLATFLNQVLPGGVLGDVSRAWRHARDADVRAAVQSVAFERLSGLVVMTTVAAASVLVLLPDLTRVADLGLLLVSTVTIFGIGVVVRRALDRPDAPVLVGDLRRALLDDGAWLVQLSTSAAVVASYIAVFVLAAYAVRLDMSAGLLALLAGPVLMTMLVPVTIAGWGLREAAAAALWSAAGLTAADGVAVSVAYGLLVLLSSLPGAVVLLTLRRSEGRDRRGGPTPAGNDAPPAGEPGPAARPPGG